MVLLKLEFLTIQVLKDVAIEEKVQNLLAEVCHSNYLGYKEKLVVKVVKELHYLFVKFVYFVEQSKYNDLLLFCSKIHVSNIPELYCHIVTLYHDSKVIRHAIRRKKFSRAGILELLVATNIQYVCTCDLCFHTKLI